MASWCCPQVSSGEVQPSVYVLTELSTRFRGGALASVPCTRRWSQCQNGAVLRRARGFLAFVLRPRAPTVTL